jgi:cytochrome c-type biogenesis protein CcmE
MKPKRKRLYLLLGSLAALGIAAFLILRALDSSLVFFLSPTMVVEQKPPADKRIRIGGLVEQDSVKKTDGDVTRFVVTDGRHRLTVSYRGVLPDLFREGQGIVAEGALNSDGLFVASQVLAKHDENYMPPEVADALKKSGHWQEGSPGGPPAPPAKTK